MDGLALETVQLRPGCVGTSGPFDRCSISLLPPLPPVQNRRSLLRSRGKGVESRRSRANADWGKSWSESNLRGEPLIETAKPTRNQVIDPTFPRVQLYTRPFAKFPCPHSLVQTFYQRRRGRGDKGIGSKEFWAAHSWLALALQTESRPTSTVRQMNERQ